MNSLKLELEVVTPLFLAGFHQEDAELRPPSIKNLMRWWYRAIRGDWRDSQEELIFGDTDQVGKFRLRIKPIGTINLTFFQPNQATEPGISYFTALSLRQGTRKCINPGTVFFLEILFLPNAKLEHKKAILASLWSLIWLGNVGTRSRRCFGSLGAKDNCTKAAFGEDILEFYFSGNTEGLSSFLSRNLAIVKKWIGSVDISTGQKDPTMPNFTLLAPSNSTLYLWKTPLASWRVAINEAGNKLMTFRAKDNGTYTPDYTQIKNFLQNPTTRPTQLSRVAFGLPLQFYFSSLRRQKIVEMITGILPHITQTRAEQISQMADGQIRAELQRNGVNHQSIDNILKESRKWASTKKIAATNEIERRSSPLFIKVLKISTTSYALLFILMKAELLPPGAQITVQGNSRTTVHVSSPDMSIIENFLSTLGTSSYQISL